MDRYDKAFKEEAVRLSDEIGTKSAAEQLGVAYYTLQGWRKQRTLHGGGAHIGSGRAYASAEKTARETLEREIGELCNAPQCQDTVSQKISYVLLPVVRMRFARFCGRKTGLGVLRLATGAGAPHCKIGRNELSLDAAHEGLQTHLCRCIRT